MSGNGSQHRTSWLADQWHRLPDRLRSLFGGNRILALKMLWACGPPWAITVGLIAVANAVLPNLSMVALGRAVGDIPAAAHSGLGSSDGHRLIAAIVLAVALYAGSLIVEPIGSALNAVVRIKIDQANKRRLMAAVSGPVGVAHLEDPALINKLDMARGTFMTYSPADAPLTLAGSIGNRLSGILACVVIGTFRWWLGLGLFIAWMAIRPPLRRIILRQITSFHGEVQRMRRAWYFLGLATQPAYAKEVRVFGLASWVIERHRRHWFDGMAASWRGSGVLTRRVGALFGAVLVMMAAVCAAVAWAAFHHEATLTQIATVLPLLPMTMSAGSVTFNDIQLEWMISALPNMRAVEDELAASASDLVGTQPAANLPAERIRFDRVSFRYPRASSDVLTDLDLELPVGRSTALVGVNGAGKTTLVKLICRLHDPVSGRILVDGTPLDRIDAEQWRRKVAVVFQDFNRYPMSAAMNIAMGAIQQPIDQDGLRDAADRTGALPIIKGLRHGWDTILSREFTDGTDLSGGQWQRIALARALYAVEHGARLLILDEPTSWLDIRGEAAFFEDFLAITRGVTSLIISHRFPTVRQADHIVVLDGGSVTEQGPHDGLLAANGTYASMFRAQAAGFESTEGAS